MTERLISLDKSVIPAADVTPEQYLPLLIGISNTPGIEAIKIGFVLGYEMTLKGAAEAAHNAGLKVIFDHQKAGTDIPDTGKEFAALCSRAAIDAAIIFPQAGPVTGEAWIKALQDAGIGVIVGGEMTHKGYKRSEGGFIAEEALDQMYLLGARNGVTDFVVPGNRAERVGHYHDLLTGLPEVSDPNEITFYSPGFIKQGGKVEDFATSAGNRWHAIVGRAIYEASDIRAAALEMTSQIR